MRRLMIVLLGLSLVACGVGRVTTPAGTTSGSATTGPASLQKLVVGLSYVPDAQFAPFYVAVREGFYRQAGFDVELKHGMVNDMLVETTTGKMQFLLAAGDEVLTARVQGVPVKMVWLWYQKFPVAVFSKAGANIKTAADLKGKTVGIPGRYGATYIGLLGLLSANGLKESDINIREIGFQQFQAIVSDKVDAAVGYSNNEPVQMQAQNLPANVIQVSDAIQLVNNGLIVTDAFAKDNADVVRRFVAATSQGLQMTLDHPDQAFNDALTFMPELAADKQPLQRKVLEASLPYWKSTATDQHGLGYQDPQAWQTTYTFLRSTAILKSDTDLTAAYSNVFIPSKP